MPLPIVFAQLPQGDNPAAVIDTQFNALAGFVFIPCQVGGGSPNILQLTPFADAPAVTAMTDLAPVFIFQATQTSNGAVTANVSGLGEFPVFEINGAPVGSGGVLAGGIYTLVFLSALNGGAGGFQISPVGGLQALAPFVTVDPSTGNVFVNPGTVIVAHGPAPSDPDNTVATRIFVQHSIEFFSWVGPTPTPGTPKPGWLWLNTSNNTFNVFDGAAWRLVATVT